MNASIQTQSIWLATAEPPPEMAQIPQLDRDLDVDVAIVGAGITGLTAAALLKRAGLRVAVVEGGKLGKHGTTHRTSAHLTAGLDREFAQLINTFGEQTARDAVEASQAAIETIESLARDLGFDNEFRRVDGYQYTELEQETDEIERDFEAARWLGLRVEFVHHLPIPIPIALGYRIPDQGQFHPLKHLYGLAKYINRDESFVFQRSHVRAYEDGEPCTITTDRGTIRANHLFLATHTPIGVWSSIQSRLLPMRSYCIAARVRLPDAAASSNAPIGLFWDNAEPYHYIRRFEPDSGNTLIIGGADTKTGHVRETQHAFEALERYTRDRFDVQSIDYRWSAEFFEPADGLPYIGLGPGMQHVYIATGFSGTGLTFGTAAAMIVSELILGREHPWAQSFTPLRLKPIASAKAVVKEAAATVKGFVAERLKLRERDINAIPLGEGRVIRDEREKVAVYRKDDGSVQAISAVCTHMGCIIEWNNAEKHWDCPCHGSIFSPDGEVMSGPAMQKLAAHDLHVETAEHAPPGRVEEPTRREEPLPSIQREPQRRPAAAHDPQRDEPRP